MGKRIAPEEEDRPAPAAAAEALIYPFEPMQELAGILQALGDATAPDESYVAWIRRSMAAGSFGPADGEVPTEALCDAAAIISVFTHAVHNNDAQVLALARGIRERLEGREGKEGKRAAFLRTVARMLEEVRGGYWAHPSTGRKVRREDAPATPLGASASECARRVAQLVDRAGWWMASHQQHHERFAAMPQDVLALLLLDTLDEPRRRPDVASEGAYRLASRIAVLCEMFGHANDGSPIEARVRSARKLFEAAKD